MLSRRLTSVAAPSRSAHTANSAGRQANVGSSCVSTRKPAAHPYSLANAYARSYYAGIASRAQVSKALASKKRRDELNTTPEIEVLDESLLEPEQAKARRNAKRATLRTEEEQEAVDDEIYEPEFDGQFYDTEDALPDRAEAPLDPQSEAEYLDEALEATEFLDSIMDDDIATIKEIARLEWRHERKEAHHAKDKARIMEKRKRRDEYVHEQYMNAHGVPLEERNGLVGLAEASARALPDDESALTKQTMEGLKESHGGRLPRNAHPQAPGGRHERIDPKSDPADVLWPDRHVNLHLEFPNATKPNDPKLEQFWLKQSMKWTGHPEMAEGSATIKIPSDLDITEPPKKSLGQRKREKQEALLPDWAKESVALEDFTLNKAIHGSGKKHGGFKVDEHGRRVKVESLGLDDKNEFGISWRDLGLGDELILAMKSQWNIASPTEIQQLSFAEFMNGTNLLIADQTGTGKTLSYLLPMLERMALFNKKNEYYKTRGQRTRALILLPNRELVQQTLGVLQTLLNGDPRFANYRTLGMFGGGDSIKRERQKLNDGLDIIISTPDRVLLHVEYEHMYLDDTTVVVFDEADSLLSSKKSADDTQTFMSQIRAVISKQKVTHAKHVQFVSASATVSPPLMEFLKKEFGQSMTSVVGSGVHRSADSLRQDFLFGASGDFKKRLLFATLKKYPGKRSIIFCNTQSQVKGVNTILNRSGYNAVAMTSDMPPKIRARHFAQFVDKEVSILISTDLASRGLDMGATVEHVILYDFPRNTIDYLHRIGRTARAGAAGVVTAFLGKSDQALASTIRDALAEGKSLASIKPKRPDMKEIHNIERKVPKRLPKHIRPENLMTDADML